MSQDNRSEFEMQAQASRAGIIGEFWDFLRHNKKWWMLPLLAVILLIGGLVLLSSTAAAPFIYTLF
ncbi:MAG: DUF5989 family protein [Tepidisphaeraceae bacterium]